MSAPRMLPKEIQPVLAEFRKGAVSLYGERLKSIIVYGSWARGEAGDHSDIDIAVVLEGEVVPGLEIDAMIELVTDIQLKYDVLISIFPASARSYAVVKSPLLENLRREGIAA